ncbi:MAG: phosphoribosylformylglycinamidine synthase subunit PurL, partial [Methanomicrobiales archaeon]|nr:phosphoribosylformylglycinamidine synthase subunit PurL [Methanomicrobiales archaeon]
MLSPQDLTLLRTTLGRDLTDVELACFENLWSEHCSYRSTKSLLKTFPTTGTDVLLGPGDDAAIVRFSETCALAIGMESHNHPSYIDPYNGAATGVGGIVRDILSMGARPIALMDPLYFGPLDNEKNRYLFAQAVAGIADYGSGIGVPVVRGELVFDPSYSGNPLVNVVCVGTVDPNCYITARVKRPGSRLVLVGAATGREGLGGASFASRDLAGDAVAVTGDPHVEKRLIEAILDMAATGNVLSCRDLGAAGLAGASSEMASTFGAIIYADRVHLREAGMVPREIMLAESQERMLIEVAPEDVARMGEIAAKHGLAWSEVGEVIDESRYIVRFHGETVADLPIDLLVGGAPLCAREANPCSAETPFVHPEAPIKDLALRVLAHPDVARKDWVYEQYDRGSRSVSLSHDAAVLRLEDKALVLSCGCSPSQIYLKPFEGAANAVIENASNLACLGAEPLCIVDCLNFASPERPEIAWQIEQCILGIGEAARRMGVPVVGGNVSLYNESSEFKTQIKPTPSIGMVGRGEIRKWTAPTEGDLLALIGATLPDFGGSVLDAVSGCGGPAPAMADPAVVAVVRDLVGAGKVTSATDLSRGGLIAALAKMAPSADVTLAGDPLAELFSETCGRFLVAVRDRSAFAGVEHRIIGTVGGDALILRLKDETVVIT